MVARYLSVLITLTLVLARIPAHAQMEMPVRAYTVDKTVDAMPPGEDFSRPERAYATMQRRLAGGNDDWKPMSVTRLRPVLPKPTLRNTPLSERAVRGYLDTRIVEVRMISDKMAYVLGQWPRSGSIDMRCVELEEGKWLNAGSSQADSLEAARLMVDGQAFRRSSTSEYRDQRTYPQEYIEPFVEFLKTSVQPPKDFLLQSLADHRLVLIGQIPHRPAYWSLCTETIRDSKFARSTGTIYLELPASGQARMDRFLAAAELDTAPLIDLLRDADWMGCPDQSLLDFCIALWNVNQSLAGDQRLRVRLVDAARPWDEIRDRADYNAIDAGHDETIARMVLADTLSQGENARHGLLVARYTRGARALRWRDEGTPIRTAGLQFAQALDRQYFAIIEHGPQITSRGSAMGRTRRGMFDSAFKANGNKPVGFALAENPFGGEPFDACADWDNTGTFQEGFDGYLYLQPLETELHSNVIEGFYTDEFVSEVSRRYEIVQGVSFNAVLGVEEPDAAAMLRWLSIRWGQPRSWRDALGSMDAWQLGGMEMQ